MAATSVSVIIPCYNEEKYVNGLLDDIINQTIKPKQVIIADCRSTDGTIAAAMHYASRLPLTIVTSAIRSPGAARNSGASVANSEYLLFTDADNWLPPTAIERFAETAKTEKVDYISPLFTWPGRRGTFQHRVSKGINRFLTSPSTAKRTIPGIGGCMFVRRSVHEASGGFDSKHMTEEDMYYLQKLKQLNVSHTILRDLYIETSDRRFTVDGKVSIVLNFIPKNSWIGKHLTYPFLRMIGREKGYGNF